MAAQAVAPGTATLTPPALSAAAATLSDKPLSERVVAYQIDARYDAQKHTLEGSEILSYRNLTGQLEGTSGPLSFDAAGDPKNGAFEFWYINTTTMPPTFKPLMQ